jgi:UDP-glucose 4-epimerase
LEAGYSVKVADNLCNSTVDILDKVMKITRKKLIFYQIDVTSESEVKSVFNKHSIDGVLHFAGLKAVGESVAMPIAYIISTLVLAKACEQYGVKRFVFSSSATVYGNNKVPYSETMKQLPAQNPYGESKVNSERILSDVSKTVSGFSVAILRYFNPVGAHESGLIGEASAGVLNNLTPYITHVAIGKLDKLKVFGNDYATADGTCIRDYIHVVDLAEGHVAALNNLKEGSLIFNLGTGKGTSVHELINVFEEANNIKIPYEIVDRRKGDISECYADVSKANRELSWKARRNILSMCKDSWRFELNKVNSEKHL